MKKICLILSSSLDFSPYVHNYLEYLNMEVDIIQWDRLRLNSESKIKNKIFTHLDSHSGHKKNYIQYIKYKKFVVEILIRNQYDKIIVFGIQLSYFLYGFLKGKEYFIDIRDYHFLSKFPRTTKILKESKAIILSSEGYKDFIPKHEKVFINHNFNTRNMNHFNENENLKIEENKSIIISAIGANRDLSYNINFINKIKNNDKFKLRFHGKSEVNSAINNFIIKQKITNVIVTGLYDKKNEYLLYKEATLINSFRDNSIYNNRLALPNKLYNAVYFKRPIITNPGSYLAEVVNRFRIGIVTDLNSKIEEEINNYIKHYDFDDFDNGRTEFLSLVINENNNFEKFLKNEFIDIEEK